MTLVHSLQDMREKLRLLFGIWKGPRGISWLLAHSPALSFFDSSLPSTSIPWTFPKRNSDAPPQATAGRQLAFLLVPSPWAFVGLGIFQVHMPPLSESFPCDLGFFGTDDPYHLLQCFDCKLSKGRDAVLLLSLFTQCLAQG